MNLSYLSPTRYHEQTKTKQNIAFMLSGRDEKILKIDDLCQGYMNKKLDIAENSLSLLMERQKTLKQRGLNTYIDNHIDKFDDLNKT